MGDLSVFPPSTYRHTPSFGENENLIPFDRFMIEEREGNAFQLCVKPKSVSLSLHNFLSASVNNSLNSSFNT